MAIGAHLLAIARRNRFTLWPAFWRGFWLREQLSQLKRGKGWPANLAESERGVLIPAILSSEMCTRVLEVGCAFGQNFHIYSKLIPDSLLVGVDPDLNAIAHARQMVSERGWENVYFICARGENLEALPDSSFDVVYTSAALLYVAPKHLRLVLQELIRVSRGRVIFLEQSLSAEPQAQSTFIERPSGVGGYWIHPLELELKELLPDATVRRTRIPHPLWRSEHWGSHGALIEVDFIK